MAHYCVHRYGGEYLGNLYGAGSGRIWMDNVQCNCMETSITQCQHNGWGRHNCGHNEDVSISCNTASVSPGLRDCKHHNVVTSVILVNYIHLYSPHHTVARANCKVEVMSFIVSKNIVK